MRHLRRPCRLQKLKFRNYQPNDEELAKSKLDKIVVEDDEITQTELLAAADRCWSIRALYAGRAAIGATCPAKKHQYVST